METRADTQAAQLLLPLATGLLIVALGAAVPAGGAALLVLLVMLTLGAVVRGHAWRTGAIAAAPVVVAAVGGAAGESLGTAAVLLLASPVLVAVLAAAAKGGSLLVAHSDGPDAGAGGWRPFETQAQRGRFLVIVAVLLVVGGMWLRNLGAGEADRAAARRVAEIRAALAGQTAATLQGTALSFLVDGGGAVPGGPYRSVQPGADRFTATDEVHKLSQFRCIRVEVDAAGAVTTRVQRHPC